MAETAPATDAGPPTPQRAARKALPRKESTATPSGCTSTKKKSKTDIAIEQAAARLAAQAPPLSEGQRRRIAELFAPAVAAVKR